MKRLPLKRSTGKRESGGRRIFRIETLEPRMLLAGDTFLVNFQHDEASIPTGYLRDSGEPFAARGGGLSYGWSSDHTDQARERSIEADQRLDTLVHFELGQQWEFQLDNGTYEVTVGVGDPANNDGLHIINVEGVNFWNRLPDTNAAFMATHQVTVADGRLTVDAGDGAHKATRINFIHMVGLPDSPNQAPDVPLVTEPAVDGQEVSPADPHMEAVSFIDADGDAHKSSDWEIWTTGADAEPVWQTLGIEGVQRLHTHLGDGIFINAQAGATSLASNTDYQLRVRFRDDAGSVSDYGTRLFRTGDASSVFPLEIEDIQAAPIPTWETLAGQAVELPAALSILSPGDTIIAIDASFGQSNYPGNESPQNAIDGTLDKYLNFGELNSGFIVTPTATATVVDSFQITTANDAIERDPTTWQLFGTNDTITSTDNSTGSQENWTLIDAGSVALPDARDTVGPMVSVTNSTPYDSYRMLFTGVKNSAAANSMQLAEIQFFGNSVLPLSAASLRLESGTGELLLSVQGTEAVGNVVTNPPSLASHVALRLVVSGGSSGLALGNTDLTLVDDESQVRTIYLPSLSLSAGDDLNLWIAADGSTYFGQPEQTEPDFSLLARSANLDIPFIATQPGFIVEQVSSNYRLPVNVAFVPDPGPNPDDPLYFVTELYGSIQVVTRDGTKHEFATGLLDYNPQGPISGSGEQGVGGIAVERDATDPEIYHLYVGMLWDNGAAPGGASHYPKVERLVSVAGGLSIDTRTVLLNMQPETQGQSHMISNITIGPDGKLYVHNGDGFDASTAQDLDQFRGKILRMNLDGSAPSDNPFYDASNGINARDYVFAYGVRNPFGGAWRAADGKHYSVENGPSVDRMAQINAGVNYGWDGSNASMFTNAIYNWDPAHAPVNMTFVQQETFNGSLFPAEKLDHAFVSESGPTYAQGAQARGKRIVEFALDGNGQVIDGPTTLVEYVGLGRSSVVGIAAGPDGLYFTELYEDSGASGPTASGARVYRVRYVGGITADFDIDGDVDGADLTRWTAGLGKTALATIAEGDADGDGDVDGADFFSWQKNYTGAAAVTTAVTTPTAAPVPLGLDAVSSSTLSHNANRMTSAVESPAPGAVEVEVLRQSDSWEAAWVASWQNSDENLSDSFAGPAAGAQRTVRPMPRPARHAESNSADAGQMRIEAFAQLGQASGRVDTLAASATTGDVQALAKARVSGNDDASIAESLAQAFVAWPAP